MEGETCMVCKGGGGGGGEKTVCCGKLLCHGCIFGLKKDLLPMKQAVCPACRKLSGPAPDRTSFRTFLNRAKGRETPKGEGLQSANDGVLRRARERHRRNV